MGIDNVSKLPCEDYCCIYTYFINIAGMYTAEALKSNTIIDSDALYHAGHMQTMLYDSETPQSPIFVLRVKVAKSTGKTSVWSLCDLNP